LTDKDNIILEKLKRKDKSGLKELFDLKYKPLCLFARNYIASWHICEDIVQNLFINLWEKQKFNSIKTNLSSYLLVTVKNYCLNYIRDNKLNQQDCIEDYIEQFGESYPEDDFDNELMQNVKEAIEELPEGAKRVFNSIVLMQMSYKETASEYNISVNTVKTQLSRALKLINSRVSKLKIYYLLLMSGEDFSDFL
jgi:RNA polymerase sigma-70 factor (ECF subfamily)